MPGPNPPSVTTLSPKHERLLLYTLAAIQFTIIIDFMIMMPLGSHLMRVFGINPTQFGLLVASYGIAAGATGFLGGFFMDRFDRRRALLVLFTGFTLATLACAYAPTYPLLLLARFAAGVFGGVASSLLSAMVGDAIPAARLGRAMGTVMTSSPLASILGVPAGLVLAGWWGWHAPFFLLGLLCLGILIGAYKILPRVASHKSDAHPVRQMWNILSHRIHIRAFMLRASLVFSGACVIPFMAPSMAINVGLDENTQIPLIYLFGGAFTFFTMPWLGRLSDRYDKVHVLIGIAALAITSILIITRLGPGPLWLTYLYTTMVFIGMSGRFVPAMALITNSVTAKYRGGFMSVNSAVQHTFGGIASYVGGLLITTGPDGRMLGYPNAGWVSCGALVVTIIFAIRLRSIAPHAARNPKISASISTTV